MSEEQRRVTVRLADAERRDLMELGMIDGTSLAEQLCKAVDFYVARRKNNPDFDKQVQTAQRYFARRYNKTDPPRETNE